MIPYDILLEKKYHLHELIESITLEDNLDEISYRANVQIRRSKDLPTLEPGQRAAVTGIPYSDSGETSLLSPGIIWDVDDDDGKYLLFTIYDLSIYLAKSEDEYLFPAGQTASQRLKHYAADWGIPLGTVTDTKIPLSKAVYRAQPIFAMIQADLNETVAKGGEMFQVRMTPSGLELRTLGSNSVVWQLETGQNVESSSYHQSLEGTITQVKVLGNASEDARSPVLAVVKGETAKYGTIQKVLNDSKIIDSKAAKSAGLKLLSGVQKTISITSIDVNNIRAGDAIILDKTQYIVLSAHHDLDNPGHMSLELAAPEYVRRRYFNNGQGSL